MTEQIRQGDVLLIKIDRDNFGNRASFDPPEERIRDGKLIIAEGEKTGHVHTVNLDEVSLEQAWFQGTFRDVIVVENKAIVSHDEHEPVTLEKGEWMVVLQEEYDPHKQRTRVID